VWRKRIGLRAGLSNADGWLHRRIRTVTERVGSVSQPNGTNSQIARLRGAASSTDMIRSSEQVWRINLGRKKPSETQPSFRNPLPFVAFPLHEDCVVLPTPVGGI
jgi:hypothetical protein